MAQSSSLRRHFLPIAFLILSIVIIFWDLFTLNKAFLSGDHREQQYPWAKYYQSQIHQGHLPWWTHNIHCGFPILAEGQIGAFYPINFVSFFLLPTKIAYNYGILFHYFLGGLFFYFYLQRLKLSRWASFFASLIFLYGSTQGGYFYYNYISQKVVIWLPLSLILIDRILEKEKARDAFFLSLVFACEIFGGYLQVAVYSLFFSTLYFLFHWSAERKPKAFLLFAVGGLLSIFFALPQLLPTYELAMFSSRANAVKEIAYIGSMTPLGFLTLLYPSWDGLLGSEMYVGVLGLFFMIYSFWGPKNRHRLGFTILFILFLLLALGEWSPLYRGIIELTGFHSFRTPIKFLFFVTFSLSVLAAFGFDSFFKQREESQVRLRPLKIFRTFVVLALILPPLSQIALKTLRPQLLPKLEDVVTKKFYGKPGHPHDLEGYKKKAANFYDSVTEAVSITKSRDTAVEWGALLFALLILFQLSKMSGNQDRGKIVCCIFLFLDLYFYGFTSIKPNYEPFASMDSVQAETPLVKRLQEDKTPFRITEMYSEDAQTLRFPVFPSTNMIYGIDDVGGYSPLVMKAYKELLQSWGGYMNDSLSTTWVEPQKMMDRIDDLKILNVKYLLAPRLLVHPDLNLALHHGSFYLYELSNPKPRAFFITGESLPKTFSEARQVTASPVILEDMKPMETALSVTTPENGYVLFSEIKYPHWNVYVDGSLKKMESWIGMFQAVRVAPGDHKIIFRYEPRTYQRFGMAALATAVLLGLYFLLAPLLKKGVSA